MQLGDTVHMGFEDGWCQIGTVISLNEYGVIIDFDGSAYLYSENALRPTWFMDEEVLIAVGSGVAVGIS